MSNFEITQEALDWFDLLPQQIWAFEKDSLRICAANSAACEWIGYERTELLRKTIVDIRPSEDHSAIRAAVKDFSGKKRDAGVWRILTKSGEARLARFHWQKARLDGKSIVLATVWDETELETTLQKSENLNDEVARLEDEKAFNLEVFHGLFESSPCKMLALRPGTYEIFAASDTYLDATMTHREDIVGKRLFDAFPDDPDDPDEPEADGVRNLRASLRRVETLKQSDFMAVQRYPIRRPDGTFEERYWAPLNQPIFGPSRNLIFIVHRVEDVTEMVREDKGEIDVERLVEMPRELVQGISSSFELSSHALNRIKEQEARFATAERLLNLGSWEYDFETSQTNWSDRVFEIYGVPKSEKAPTGEEYLALVHPDDQAETLRNHTEFFESGAKHIQFAHRVIHKDGSLAHIRGVGERHVAFGKEIVVGFVQDVTDEVQSADTLTFAQNLARIGGKYAKLGGWRVDLLGDPKVHWSNETAIIHGVAPGYQPTFEEAIEFYVEEDRQRIVEEVTRTMEEGVRADFTARIRTRDGETKWVRAIGEPVYGPNGEIEAVHGAFQDIGDLVEARDEAEQLTQKLSTTLESIGDAFFTLDADWRFTFVNRHAEKILRRPRAELMGERIWDMFPEAVGTRFQSEYEAAVDTREVARFVEYFEPLDLCADVSAYPVPDGLAVYFRDIGDEMARNERLALLETAVSRIGDILLITEAEPLDAPDGPKIIYVNEAFEKRTGYTPEEVIGQTPRILQGPETDEAELENISRALRKWQPVRSELINYTKSGEPFWLELDIVPIANEDGWYTHWVAIERDITERKLASQKEEEVQRKFRAISEVTNDFVWEYDVKSDIWQRGPRHLQMLGLSSESNPRSFEETVNVVHPEDRGKFMSTFLEALDSGKDQWECDYRIIDGEGHTRYFENQGAILRDKAGKPLRVVGGLSDVTEYRELDRRLRESQKMEAVGQLTGGVAHDFNNLLTIILANAEELSEELTGNQKLRVLAEMTTTAAERGAELTSRLLSFARRQTLDPAVLDLNRKVKLLEPLLRRTLPESISLEIVGSAGLWKAEVDRAQLETAILNLALNARDAMPDGGKLTIETANAHLDGDYVEGFDGLTPGQYVVVSVSDTGFGMTPETKEKVFEPFFTTKPVGEGTGLGLSMVFGFAKQSKGHVSIYSEVNEGTTVKLYFPRAYPGQTPEVAAPVAKDFKGGTERILVVEDEPLVRENLERQLKALGYSVSIAENGDEAMRILRSQENEFDLLLTDVVMPGGMNGRELAEQAVKLWPDLKVLFTSGYTENAVVHQGRLKPNVQLLSKPYRRRTLARKLREVLDKP